MIENLAVAVALGVLALVVAAITLAADARSFAEERGYLVPSGSSWSVAGRCDDPAFARVFRILSDSATCYATTLTIRSLQGQAFILGASFSPKGELLGLRFVGSCSAGQVSDPGDLVDSIPGAGEAVARASDFVRALEAERSGQGS
jgi:hypothetical protein